MEKIEQNWKIQVHNEEPLYPFLVVDNWYLPQEEKAIWAELNYYSSLPKELLDRAETTVVAKNKDGSPKGKSFRFYINDYYAHNVRQISPSINTMYKFRTPEFHNIIDENFKPYSRSFITSNGDNTMISYYDKNDEYETHHDTMLWTMLIWMAKEPFAFEGGDFELTDNGCTIKMKNNRMVAFPSCLEHRVTPLKFKNKNEEFGLGKYTITHFFFTLPNGI